MASGTARDGSSSFIFLAAGKPSVSLASSQSAEDGGGVAFSFFFPIPFN